MAALKTIVLPVLWALIASASLAAGAYGPDADRLIARSCGHETLRRAVAVCVADLADQTILKMEERIARLTDKAAGASARAISEFGRAVGSAQRDWREGMETECGAGTDALARQRCRLALSLDRAALLDRTLARALTARGLAERPAPSDCRLLLDLLPRPYPQIECDWSGLVPDAPGIGFR